MKEPLHTHWVVAKHVLRYLHGIVNLGLRYIVGCVKLHGYTGDRARIVVDRKSTSRCSFSIGSIMKSWKSENICCSYHS